MVSWLTSALLKCTATSPNETVWRRKSGLRNRTSVFLHPRRTYQPAPDLPMQMGLFKTSALVVLIVLSALLFLADAYTGGFFERQDGEPSTPSTVGLRLNGHSYHVRPSFLSLETLLDSSSGAKHGRKLISLNNGPLPTLYVEI